ncbi:hypothetical protein C8J57DRAFT_1383472, partial [Mycena rebaudengoi]
MSIVRDIRYKKVQAAPGCISLSYLLTMYFTRTLSSLVLFALSAVQVQAAAAPGAHSSLTKRNWCGFDSTCSCTPGPKCELTLDTCSGEYFWPTTCKGCEPCVQQCVEFFTCIPQNKPL